MAKKTMEIVRDLLVAADKVVEAANEIDIDLPEVIDQCFKVTYECKNYCKYYDPEKENDDLAMEKFFDEHCMHCPMGVLADLIQ